MLPKAASAPEMMECHSPQPPLQVMCHQPRAAQGTYVWKRGAVNILKPSETNVYLGLLSLKTYVSVLTVSSFRPTIGLSISRSRRLVQGETLCLVSGAGSMWFGKNFEWLGRNPNFWCTSWFNILPLLFVFCNALLLPTCIQIGLTLSSRYWKQNLHASAVPINVIKNARNCLENVQTRRILIYCIILLVGATEEGQVVLVDVLGNVETVGLDQLLVLCQFILVNRAEWKTVSHKELKLNRSRLHIKGT